MSTHQNSSLSFGQAEFTFKGGAEMRRFAMFVVMVVALCLTAAALLTAVDLFKGNPAQAGGDDTATSSICCDELINWLSQIAGNTKKSADNSDAILAEEKKQTSLAQQTLDWLKCRFGDCPGTSGGGGGTLPTPIPPTATTKPCVGKDGDYCENGQLVHYECGAEKWRKTCSNGCVQMPPGVPDRCAGNNPTAVPTSCCPATAIPLPTLDPCSPCPEPVKVEFSAPEWVCNGQRFNVHMYVTGVSGFWLNGVAQTGPLSEPEFTMGTANQVFQLKVQYKDGSVKTWDLTVRTKDCSAPPPVWCVWCCQYCPGPIVVCPIVPPILPTDQPAATATATATPTDEVPLAHTPTPSATPKASPTTDTSATAYPPPSGVCAIDDKHVGPGETWTVPASSAEPFVGKGDVRVFIPNKEDLILYDSWQDYPVGADNSANTGLVVAYLSSTGIKADYDGANVFCFAKRGNTLDKAVDSAVAEMKSVSGNCGPNGCARVRVVYLQDNAIIGDVWR